MFGCQLWRAIVRKHVQVPVRRDRVEPRRLFISLALVVVPVGADGAENELARRRAKALHGPLGFAVETVQGFRKSENGLGALVILWNGDERTGEAMRGQGIAGCEAVGPDPPGPPSRPRVIDFDQPKIVGVEPSQGSKRCR